MVEATVNTEEWALRLNKELTEARTRIAALEEKLAENVKVKPLEWRKGRAETPFGPYHVIEETNDDEPFWFVMFNGKAAARCGTHDDEESAIFAAQADYERRALCALEATPPAPKVTDAMRVKLWVTVRVEDTGDGLIINADDAKEYGLKPDAPYEGKFMPDGSYRIALTAAQESGE